MSAENTKIKTKKILPDSGGLLSVDIYNQKTQFKIAIFVLAAMLALTSMFYTNRLLKQLEDREERQIQLYAKALKYVVTGAGYDENMDFIMNNVLRDSSNTSIPLIYETEKGALTAMNIDLPKGSEREVQEFLRGKLQGMKGEHPPVEVVIDENKNQIGYVYYSNSFLLTQLRYYPVIQLFVVLFFGVMAYVAFSNARRAEQNQVWIGLAKETAHQLGTPLSSLTAWVEFFKTDPEHYDPDIVVELAKDVQRLDMITTRFSNIGSVPTLKPEDVAEVVRNIAEYLQRRISTKVKMQITNELGPGRAAPLNRYLFEWVIENLCKNAVDAMGGIGELTLELKSLKNNQIAIDVTDTGKGIPKGSFQKVFNPGFTTKKRGWGLGLTLAKRIIENYHNGKLTVLRSEVGKGTTFRIQLDA
jgi:nitrogen-specific signal transduction histidine kinase